MKAYGIWKTIPRNLNHVQCLNKAPMEKACFYGRLFFKVVTAMVKDKKKYSIKKLQITN